MKPIAPLRIASVATLIYSAGHTSGMPWMSPDGPETTALAEAMRSFTFDAMGATRTVWDFHIGFGLIISVDLLVQAFVLWHLGTMSKTEPVRIRPLIAAYGLAFVANAVLVSRYFFAVPVVMASAIALCLGLAFLFARPRASAELDTTGGT